MVIIIMTIIITLFDDDENYVHIIKCGRYETLTKIVFSKKEKKSL